MSADTSHQRRRDRDGIRTDESGGHYALCNGFGCPCYQEGREDAAPTDLAGCDAYTGCQSVCNCTEEP